MSLFFANPIGLLSLLAVPALLAIYFFQRRSKQYFSPTMFLIKNQFEHRTGGRQFKRFQRSWPLLFQLLALLLLTFLIVQPRIKKSESTQKVALVLDPSASMSAFKEELEDQVEAVFSVLENEGGSFSIQIFEAVPESPALYSGSSPQEAQEIINSWSPYTGVVDPTAALNLARSRLGPDGLLLYFTDHLPEASLVGNAKVIAVGRPLDNVGFSGVSVKKVDGQSLAQVLVKNYGRYKEERPYEVRTASGEEILKKEVTLDPGQVKTLSFPLTKERAEICFTLAPDDFPLDDVAPIILAKKKSLSVGVKSSERTLLELGEKLAAAVGSPPPSENISPDLLLLSQPRNELAFPSTNSIHFITPPEGEKLSVLTDPIIPASSELTEDLIWDSLIVPAAETFPVSTRDEVLLWAGGSPLLSLRYTEFGGDLHQHLLCHFPIKGSNIHTQASLAILFFRFSEQIRENKEEFYSELAEVNQSLKFLSPPVALSEESPLELASTLQYAPPYQQRVSSASDLRLLRLPAEPNITTVSQAGQPIATFASYFADTREADFSEAKSQAPKKLISASEKLNTTKPLPYAFLFILLLVFLALLSWAFSAQKHSRSSKPITT